MPPLSSSWRLDPGQVSPLTRIVIEEREIWACANHLIGSRGDAASFHAAQRADELFADGDLDGHRTWLRILDRIRQLEALTPPSYSLN